MPKCPSFLRVAGWYRLPHFLLAIILLALAAIPAHALPISVSGTLTANTTWDNTAEPYEINNFIAPLTVAANATLTIAPGVKVKNRFSNKESLIIQDALVATGATFTLTASDSLVGGKQAVVVSGSGTAQFTSCTIAVTDTAPIFSL